MKPRQTYNTPMFTLITGGFVYAPEKLGRKDILITGGIIARIADRIDLPEDFKPLIFRAKGRKIVPGLVDLHVHLLGGGGEAGPVAHPRDHPVKDHSRRGDHGGGAARDRRCLPPARGTAG